MQSLHLIRVEDEMNEWTRSTSKQLFFIGSIYTRSAFYAVDLEHALVISMPILLMGSVFGGPRKMKLIHSMASICTKSAEIPSTQALVPLR